MWLAFLFISLGIVARLIPHVPNFAPVAAVALFSGLYWRGRYGVFVPLLVYIISDLIIGLHDVVLFTWTSMVVVYFLGIYLRKRKTFTNLIVGALVSSVFFFLVTNFGVWLAGWYPRNLEGLISCYVYALPFFRVSLLANFAYIILFSGAYEYFLSRFRLTQKAV
ncbi:MAG: hypothetical protein GF375_03850 [Candidatus Omnitrophica bacterium]|nr:hypothetical protein [Candidatus Omnitrophota bacterium]MBD3269193.1 hypothetical protein [Candidatus Omnitrophota bacterium]